MECGNKSLLKCSWSHEMAALPICDKKLKNLLLWNQKAEDLETWDAASRARVLPCLLKFGPLCLCMGKR